MMADKLFKAVKAEMPECNKLPQQAKDILNTANNSLNDLDKNDAKELWVLLHDCIKEISVLKNPIKDMELLKSYQCVLNLVHCAILCTREISCIFQDEHLTNSIMIFQSFYTLNVKKKFKLEIIQMYLSFWKLFNPYQNGTISEDIDKIMTQNMISTVDYLSSTIESTTIKSDMDTFALILGQLWNLERKVLPTDQPKLDFFSSILLNRLLKCKMYLETETGKLTIAYVFAINEKLFLRFRNSIKNYLPLSNKAVVESYSEIYFIAWKKSDATMRKVIEQEGLSDIIYSAIGLQRQHAAFVTFRKVLVFLQCLQKHKTDIMFSRVITQLYAPILWRSFTHEFSTIRCNSVDMLVKVYPLVKRGEPYNVSATFLIKQQDALLNALNDNCVKIQVSAIQGISMCMKQFWNTFKENQIIKCFKIFLNLIDENHDFEISKMVFHGFTQLLDISESHSYLKNSELFTKAKEILMNEDKNSKVRLSVSHFLLKVKKVDSKKSEGIAKINYQEIVNLQDISIIFAQQCEDIRYNLVDLIFDYFYGDNVHDENIILMRLNEFYKINVTSFRNMIFFTKKKLNLNDACKLMLMLLPKVYCLLRKTEHLNNTNMDNNIHVKGLKTNSDSENIGDINTSLVGINDYDRQNKDSCICCILDCVNCLIVVHRKTFKKDCNRQQLTEIEDSCISCIVEILKFHKDDAVYVCAMCLAALVPFSKSKVYTSVLNTALSTLKELPNDVEQTRDINENLPNCLSYVLTIWNQGHKIIQLVTIWYERAFKTLNLNETLTFKTKEENVFETNSEECKHHLGILLMTSMLSCKAIVKRLADSGINEHSVHELILCLENIKPAVENRILLDHSLNDVLEDEILFSLFNNYMKLNVVYYHYDTSLINNKIVNHQMSIFDWIIEKLLIKDLQNKNEWTRIFVVRIIKVVNAIVFNCFSVNIGTHAHLNKFFIMCSAVIDNHLGNWILLHMVNTFKEGLHHLNYLKVKHRARNNMSTLHNCVAAITSIISFFENNKVDEEDFKRCIGQPKQFYKEFCRLILELKKLSEPDFHHVFLTFIEAIMVIIDNEIRTINNADLINKSITMPFPAFQLTRVILYNVQLKKYFSDHIVKLFSSRIYKNDCIRLLSAIHFIFNITLIYSSVQQEIDFSPILKLLFKMLTKPENYTPLFDSEDSNLDISIFEGSRNTNIYYIKAKGRTILVNTAQKLRLTLVD